MIRIAAPVLSPPHRARPPHTRVTRELLPREPQSLYDRSFWLAYVAYALQTGAVAVLYRYADFVTLLGGTEFHLGWIVGVGMVGSLVVRLTLGSWIDRAGAGIVWLGATGALAAICFAHLTITSYSGVAIYALRICTCCAIAGMYGASSTFITSRGPSQRIAESVGMLGTAGFFGTALGPVIGDILFGSVAIGHRQVAQMFIAAGVLGLLSLPFAWAASRAEIRPRASDKQPIWNVMRRYGSARVMFMGVAMGIGLGLPSTFLRTFTAGLNIPRISLFFVVFSVAAIATRVFTRRWFERFGNRRMIVLGMAGLVASHLLLLLVHSEWQLILPAIGYGAAQAVVLPAIIAAGSVAYPLHNRGLAMMLILAASDLGQLIGAPLTGELLRWSAAAGLPPYPTMFTALAGLLAAASVWYAVSSRKPADRPAAS